MGFYDYHDFEYTEENRGNPLILQIPVQTFFPIYFCLNFVSTLLIKSFCRGGPESVGQCVSESVNQWVGGSVGQKVRRIEGEKLSGSKRRLEASKPFLHENSNALYDYRHFDTFSADSVQLKKPPGGPKGLIGPPPSMPWGPGRRRHRFPFYFNRRSMLTYFFAKWESSCSFSLSSFVTSASKLSICLAI